MSSKTPKANTKRVRGKSRVDCEHKNEMILQDLCAGASQAEAGRRNNADPKYVAKLLQRDGNAQRVQEALLKIREDRQKAIDTFLEQETQSFFKLFKVSAHRLEDAIERTPEMDINLALRLWKEIRAVFTMVQAKSEANVVESP